MLGVIPQLSAPDGLDIELAAREVAVDLGMARRLAIADHANYVAAFSPAGGPYTSYSVGIQGGSVEPDFPKSFAPGVTVTGVDQIVFAPAGSALTSGTITVSFAKGTSTATVQIIAATGRVRVIGP
ncbi:MAG TPA: GspH/FimT family protein [bacterium]|nr:GspH/FimT family protein [bacterium]